MKPVLFLDYDRTLFDTDKFYDWLGEDRFQRILDVTSGHVLPPNFAEYLYHDTVPFLKRMRNDFRIVLLTFAKNTKLQRMKIRGSGIVPLLDDIIITIGENDGSTGKGGAINEYFQKTGDSGWEHVFVDDDTRNLLEVKSLNPDIRVIRIDREKWEEERADISLLTPDAVVKNLTELEALL